MYHRDTAIGPGSASPGEKEEAGTARRKKGHSPMWPKGYN